MSPSEKGMNFASGTDDHEIIGSLFDEGAKTLQGTQDISNLALAAQDLTYISVLLVAQIIQRWYVVDMQ